MGSAASYHYDDVIEPPQQPHWMSYGLPSDSQLRGQSLSPPLIPFQALPMSAFSQGPLGSELQWPGSAQPAASSWSRPPDQVGNARQGSHWCTPQYTLIIYDWDDTLMCSSAINSQQFNPYQGLQLESLLEQVLHASMALGETIIVTNADELWVQESTKRFAPRVMPLLSQMRVISARRKYEPSYPGDVFAWKREAFREVLSQRSPGGMNLVVLGDSPAEMLAAHTAVTGLPQRQLPVFTKTVKFKEAPSVDDLLQQLQVLVPELASIVADEKSGCRHLASWMQVPHQAAPLGYSPMQGPYGAQAPCHAAPIFAPSY